MALSQPVSINMQTRWVWNNGIEYHGLEKIYIGVTKSPSFTK